MSTENLPEFFARVLSALEIDPSDWAINFLLEWAAHEGTGAEQNPLATTLAGGEDPDDPYWNTFGDNSQYHVRNYASRRIGISQTADTLELGYYAPIRATLAAAAVRPGTSDAIRTWGTTSFAEELELGWTPAAAVPAVTIESLVQTMEAVGLFEWQRGGYAPLLPTIQQLQRFDNELDDRLRRCES